MVNGTMRPENVARLADLVVRAVGTRSLLNLHADAQGLAPALWRRGAEVSDVRIERAAAAVLSVAQPGFETVIFQADAAMIYDDQGATIMRELHRTSSRWVFLWLWCPPEQGHDAANGRRLWWEQLAFEAGFRKHPAYYRVNEYEALNRDGPLVCVPLEKMPAEALAAYPLESLAAERGLHMDMLRDPGERSDAHVARYDWACGYVKPGDRVLDAACGLGYGTHLMSRLTDAASLFGIDGSEYAIDYARQSYGDAVSRTSFECGLLPDALARFEDGSFDTIVSFETLEHVQDPEAVLREFHRLLSPGGRVVVSVPNDWSDETGEDPNPYHLHVYDWRRLRRELEVGFVVDEAFAQTASQYKLRDAGKEWVRRGRELRRMPLVQDEPANSEWWLMSAMKSPLGATQPYRERVFANIADGGHASIRYAEHFANPWLMHAMVNVTYRMRDGAALETLATEVLVKAPPNSNDYAAALCVKAYRVIDRATDNREEAADVVELIDAAVAHPPAGPMGLRWKVSLLFVRARLFQSIGSLDKARASFEECATHDVRGFGIHLSTRVSESWFVAGKLAYSLGDLAGAKRDWQRGVEFGEILLSSSLDEILIERDFPNRFNHGDGVREYTVAWDNVARCANGLHLLHRGEDIDDAALENCFQSEYAIVLNELLQARRHLAERDDELIETRRLLIERTERLERATEELHVRTEELVGERRLLLERTRQAEALNRDLHERTGELVAVRALLAERTALLAGARGRLPDTAKELVHAREELVDRTSRLEVAAADLVERTRELEATRAELADRTRRLEALHAQVDRRNAELVAAREAAAAAAHELEQSRRGLKSRSDKLEQANQDLADRTGQFRAANYQLHEAHRALHARTAQAEALERELQERTADLLRTREALIERTRRLEELAATLHAIHAAPVRHAIKALFRKQ